jgi:predicted  nucleic acid-binding Zn ribbon protein
MCLARITFGPDIGSSRERDALSDVGESYLAALLKNGQIYGEYLLAWSNGTLVAYTHVARPDSLAERYHSEWAMSDLNAVAKAFGRVPRCEIIDDDVRKRFRSWKHSTSFYLFTHAFDDASPIRCGDTGRPIPLYLLPITQQARQDLYFWARSYNYHEHIWLGSAALEIPAYKQLADPTSDLSVTGRQLCVDVERATKTPTFYFVDRYWGRNVGEAGRPCPVCGGKWHSSGTRSDGQPFHRFHFRCKRCRLVSHCADSYDDERHARIGEFTKAK